MIGLLLAALIAYVGLIPLLFRQNPDVELFFGMAAAEPPLDLTLNMVSVDPVRQAIDVRIEATKPSESRQWQQRSIEPADMRNLLLHIDDRYLTYQVALQDSRTKTVLEIGLSGSISGYPLDHYTGRLSISAKRWDSEVSQPIRLTVWPLLSNWNVDIATDEASKASTGIDLRLQVNRPTSFIVMAFAFYAAMALIGLSGLTIGALVFLGVRPLQPPMTAALAAMIFSIPALRGIMPGAPPLRDSCRRADTCLSGTGGDSWSEFVRNHLGFASLKSSCHFAASSA